MCIDHARKKHLWRKILISTLKPMKKKHKKSSKNKISSSQLKISKYNPLNFLSKDSDYNYNLKKNKIFSNQPITNNYNDNCMQRIFKNQPRTKTNKNNSQPRANNSSNSEDRSAPSKRETTPCRLKLTITSWSITKFKPNSTMLKSTTTKCKNRMMILKLKIINYHKKTVIFRN